MPKSKSLTRVVYPDPKDTRKVCKRTHDRIYYLEL